MLELIFVILLALCAKTVGENVCGKLQKSQLDRLNIDAGTENQDNFDLLLTENKRFEVISGDYDFFSISTHINSRDSCGETIQRLKMRVQFVSRIAISITNVNTSYLLTPLKDITITKPGKVKEVNMTFQPGVWWITLKLYPITGNPKKIVVSKYQLEVCLQASCQKNPIDVAIIGAGASGLFTAWQLSQQHPEWKISVFDAADRIGGRIDSATVPGITDFKADLGAAKIHTKHNLTLSVINSLGLTVQPQFTANADETMYYLRQKLLTKQDIATGRVPYDLTKEERKRTFRIFNLDLHSYWNEKILANESTKDPWRRMCTDGLIAYQKGTYNAFLEQTSQDAIEFAAYKSLFTFRYFENVNYVDFSTILPFSEVDPDVTPPASMMYRVEEGMDEIPKRMADRFLIDGEKKRQILTNHQLMSVKYMNKNTVLRFKDTKEQTVKEICAKHVITALPVEALKRINIEDSELSAALDPLLPAVTPVPAARIYLAYDRPWWRKEGRRSAFKQLKKQGINLKLVGTDMALGHLQDAGVDNKTGNALLMAYVDLWKNVKFWRDVTSKNINASEEYVIRQMNKMLSKIFKIPLGKLPQPYHVVSKVWSGAPIWSAWHAKAPGFIYPDVAKKIKKPSPNRNFYVMGEAFGEYHGWVESALRTADEILTEYFDVIY